MSTRKFPGRYDSLVVLSKFIAEQAASAGLNESETYAVQLAVDEAASNIIDHAYGGEDRGQIECTCTIGKNELEVVLRDWGKSFIPDKVPSVPIGAPLEEFGPRGAGLFLMKKLMDEVHFKSEQGGNVLTMVKRKKKTD